MLGPFGDAVRALIPHAKPCYTCEKRTQKIEAEWREFSLTLTSYMEQMNAWAARQAKRDKRALGRVLAQGAVDEAVEEPAPAAVSIGRKAELRARLARGR